MMEVLDILSVCNIIIISHIIVDMYHGADWPRSVVYDLVCDPSSTGENGPESLYEWPSYTYKGSHNYFDNV